MARQYVCLPPLKNNVGEVKEFKCGCETQMCASTSCQYKGEALDRVANHGLICNPGVKAMKATLLEKSLEKSFRVAGGNLLDSLPLSPCWEVTLRRISIKPVSWKVEWNAS